MQRGESAREQEKSAKTTEIERKCEGTSKYLKEKVLNKQCDMSNVNFFFGKKPIEFNSNAAHFKPSNGNFGCYIRFSTYDIIGQIGIHCKHMYFS